MRKLKLRRTIEIDALSYELLENEVHDLRAIIVALKAANSLRKSKKYSNDEFFDCVDKLIESRQKDLEKYKEKMRLVRINDEEEN